ncbi:MAG: DUF4065 domain-containing protein [Prevotella sp.]|nr:DUF4065 domain-containing protein [Prevotella sp.]
MIKQFIVSPFTGRGASLMHEPATLVFRKETFPYIHQYYECDVTHERFTTEEIDEANLAQVYNQYRAKYGIPFPEEIKRIRQHYGLSATKMSEILGFGENQYRLYENGDMPSEANGKVLMLIMNPEIFRVFVVNARGQFSEEEFQKIMSKVSVRVHSDFDIFATHYLFSTTRRSISNGYANQSISKLKNVLLYFIEKSHGIFFTKMNKLLFYTDFLTYKTLGRGMTGLCYRAIDFGPVPEHWDRIYSFFDEIQQEIVHFSSGKEGTRLTSTLSPDMSEFSEQERNLLDTVYHHFRAMSSTQISETSHKEEAWKKNVGTAGLIDYHLAFGLKAI